MADAKGGCRIVIFQAGEFTIARMSKMSGSNVYLQVKAISLSDYYYIIIIN